MKNAINKIGLARAVSLLSLAVAGPAFGQSTASADAGPDSSTDIIVTAQKRSETARDVPMSITALGGARLTELGVNGTEDLAKVVPGFSFAQSFTNAPIYTLRGVGLNETTLAAGPTVGVYVDEVPLPFSVMTRGASLDLERVEVLKGPQGTLYGQNSTGGAINYIAAKPQETFAGGGSISFSRFATVDAQAHVTGPLSDGLNARLAVQAKQGGNWQQFEGDPDRGLGQTDFLQGRLLLAWNPSSNVRLLLNVNGWRDRSDSQAPQLNAKVIQIPGNANPVIAAAQPNKDKGNRVAAWDIAQDYRNDDSFYQFAFKGEIDLSPDITLTSISAYSRYKQDELRDIDGSSSQILLLGSDGEIESISQELRLTGQTGPINWIVGGNYARNKSSEFQTFAIAQQSNNLIFGFPNSAAALTSRQTERSIGVFGNVEVAVSDALTVQGGIRYTDAKQTIGSCSLDSGSGNLAGIMGVIQTIGKGAFGLPPGPAPVAGGCIPLNANYDPVFFTDTLKEDSISWRAGVKYEVGPSAMVYANVSRGYKNGLFPTVLATATTQYAPVRQEHLTAYEVGFKFATPDRALDVSAAAFYYNYRDKQVRTRILDPIFSVLEAVGNAPRSDVKGAEMQVIVRPTDGLTFNIGGTYLDAKILEFTSINQLGQPDDFSNTRTPFTSKWQAFGDAEYRWPLSATVNANLGASLSYTSDANAFLGDDPIGMLDARTLIDLRAGIASADDSWSLSVWGRNVTDQNYQNYVVRVTDTVVGYAGRPATYGITLGVNFK